MIKVYSIVVWGKITSSQGWIEWFRFMEDSSKFLGSPLTHFGIKGDGLGTKNIRSIDKFPKVEAAIKTTRVDWLSGYSLPKEFQTAVFDYNIHMNLSSSYVSFSAREAFAKPLLSDPEEWRQRVTQFCSFRTGMLFQMDESECPLLFISGSASKENFRSMNILKEFK